MLSIFSVHEAFDHLLIFIHLTTLLQAPFWGAPSSFEWRKLEQSEFLYGPKQTNFKSELPKDSQQR